MYLLGDSEQRSAIFSLRVGFFVLAFFIISGVRSCGEIRYTLTGVETEARVFRSADVRERRREFTEVSYRFKDEDDVDRRGSFEVPKGEWHGANGDMVEIIYASGNPNRSTRPEDRSGIPIVIFLVITAAGSLWCWQAYRLAKRGILI